MTEMKDHAADDFDDDPECDDDGMPFFAADGALVTPGVEPLTAEGAEALAVRAGFSWRLETPEEEFNNDAAELLERDSPAPITAARSLAGTFGGAIVDPADALPIPAPTLADDVAALRAKLLTTRMGGDKRDELLVALDRIAARAPQRATATPDGRPLWQHGCGRIASGPGCTGPACRSCGEVGGWRALYVIDGGA